MVLILGLSLSGSLMADQAQDNLQPRDLVITEYYNGEEEDFDAILDYLIGIDAETYEIIVETSPCITEDDMMATTAEYDIVVYESPYIANDDMMATTAEYDIVVYESPYIANDDMMTATEYDVVVYESPYVANDNMLYFDVNYDDEIVAMEEVLPGGGRTSARDEVTPMSTTLVISPATAWTNIPAAGGAQRTVTVTTNAPNYTLSRPVWLTHQFLATGFRLTATQNTTAATRSGTVSVTAGNQMRSFTVTQLAGATTLTISPTTAWTNIPAAGGAQRTVTVTTNAPTYTLSRPAWMTHQFLATGFRLTATQNTTTAARSGTVSVTAGNQVRSFTVTQLAGATTLTISPATAWTSIPAAGGAQRTVTVTTNAPNYTLSRPAWLTHQFLATGFRLTATQNTTTAARSGTVSVTAGNQVRSFTVTQLAGATTLTISPTTAWTNIPAAGGAQRAVTVTTNAPNYTVSRPSWLTLQFTATGFTLTATRNTTLITRSGTVTVTGGNQTRSFSVSQAAAAGTAISPRNGTGTFYVQAQGRNLFLQGSSVRTRNLPSQQWQITHNTTINGSRYFRLTQGSTILAVTGDTTVSMIAPGSLAHAYRGLWRFEHVGNYHYRIVNRWTSQNARDLALTSATANGGAATLQARGAANQLWYTRNRANFLHNRTERPYPWRVSTRSFSVFLCTTSVQGSGWEQAIRNGITAWNASSGTRYAGVSISLRTTGAQTPHMFEARNRSTSAPTNFGSISYTRMGSGNIIEHSVSRIYAARINDYVRGTNMSALNVARSVAAHEIGHMFGLGDNPPGFTSSIMHGNRNRNVVIQHNAFDARNVRIMYGAA